MTEKGETTEGGGKPEHPCQCYAEFLYFQDADHEGDEIPVYGPCGRTTRRQFAIGHDAKLKSVLIRLYRAGDPYLVLQDGVLTDKDPRQVAAERGWERFLTPAKPKPEPKGVSDTPVTSPEPKAKKPAKKAAAKKAKVA